MEAKELIKCIEKFLEVKAKELEEGRQLEILKGMLQTIKTSAARPLCENCLYHERAFCSKLKRNTFALSCAQWEENSMGLDIIAY